MTLRTGNHVKVLAGKYAGHYGVVGVSIGMAPDTVPVQIMTSASSAVSLNIASDDLVKVSSNEYLMGMWKATNGVYNSTNVAGAVDPNHYKFPGGIEVRQISAHLTSFGGQALQYIARATRLDGNNKGEAVEDLEKAVRLIQWEIERLQGDNA